MQKKVLSRAQAILHPVRARIIVAVSDRRMTPREIAHQMEEIPLGTVYRHINILRDVGMLTVVGERRVHGTTERQFALVEDTSYVNREEIGPEEIMGLVTALTGVLQVSFGRYVQHMERPLKEGEVSMVSKSLLLTKEESSDLRDIMFRYVKKVGRQPSVEYERRIIAFFSVPEVEVKIPESQ